MAPAWNVLSLLLGVVSVARADPTYVTINEFQSKDGTCEQRTATTIIWALDICTTTMKVSMGAEGNVTVTKYTDNNCTDQGKVTFSAPVNTCANYAGTDAIITSASDSFAQACAGLNYPWVANYKNDKCTGTVVMAAAPSGSCYNAKGAKTSTSQRCVNETAVLCTFQSADCTGTPACKPLATIPTGTCAGSAATGAWTEYICPSNDASFCPAIAKKTTNSPGNKVSGGEIAGIVTASILIPLIIIVVVVVAIIFIKKAQNGSGNGDLLSDERSKTNYGSA